MIGLYFDRDLTSPLQRKTVDDTYSWIIDFGRLDAGENKTFPVYVENQSVGAIEELKIEVEPIQREGIDVTVSGSTLKRLENNEIHMFTVGWKVKKDAKLGRCSAHINISGYITE